MCATSYYNVWSADNTLTTGNDNKVVKTVYDPFARRVLHACVECLHGVYPTTVRSL